MALINRISRLFKADLHAVLDNIEEPESLLKQSVREMEDDLESHEQRLKNLQLERMKLQASFKDINESLDKANDELDICFASNNDELAHRLVRRKLEAERCRDFINRKHENLKLRITQTSERIDENRKRLQSMQQKLELFASSASNNEHNEYQATPSFQVEKDEVDVAFLREKQLRAQA